jgi:hypothetical protein
MDQSSEYNFHVIPAEAKVYCRCQFSGVRFQKKLNTKNWNNRKMEQWNTGIVEYWVDESGQRE